MKLSGPPNPRHARYRQMPIHWSGCPLTILLIAVCVVVAAVSQLGRHSDPVAALYCAAPPAEELETRWTERISAVEAKYGEDSPEATQAYQDFAREVVLESSPYEQIAKGQAWRLVTPMFLHFGTLHLVFNLMWLWNLGLMLETRLRRLRFALLVVAISLVSNVAQAAFGQSTNFGGMSGVIYGLFGFVALQQRLLPASGLFMDSRNTRFMLIWLVVCFTGLVGPIANWAHTFGLLAGGAIGGTHALLNGGWKTLRRRREFRLAAAHAQALHQCAVCAKTEQHDPDLEFRVHTDDQEYCIDHLPDQSYPMKGA
jgi:membrane associated rhomboid family serine protease